LEVKTLHSMMWRRFCVDKKSYFPSKLVGEADGFGLAFGNKRSGIETVDDLALLEFNRLRNRMMKPAETSFSGYMAERVMRMAEIHERAWKKGWWDFTRLLEMGVESGFQITSDFLGVDEVQDCSRLQLELLRNPASEEAWYLGDMDQSIYTWNGVDAKDIECLQPHEVRHLSVSYRVPIEIAGYADLVLSQASWRSPGCIETYKVGGEVVFAKSFEDLCSKIKGEPNIYGSVMILGRTQLIVDQAIAIGRRYGLNFPTSDRYDRKKVLENLLELLARGGEVENSFVKALLSEEIDQEIYLSDEGLKRIKALDTRGRTPAKLILDEWVTGAFNDLKEDGVEALFGFDDEVAFDPKIPRVRAMTMHKAKGLEDATVILLRDSTPKVELSEDFDESVRLAYVSATRALNRLIICQLGDRFMRQVIIL